MILKNIGLFFLRTAFAITLLFYHGREEAIAAWGYIWREPQTPWPTLNLIFKAGYPIHAFIPGCVIALGIIAAFFLILGFATRIAAGILSFIIGCAAWVFWKTGLGSALETTVAFALISLTLLLLGGGELGLDRFFHKRPKSGANYYA